VLFTIGDQVEGVCEADGRVTVRIGSLTVGSGNVQIPLEAWCLLQVVYSGRDLRLFLNRAPVSAPVLGKSAWSPGGAFTVGNQKQGFTGIVDEIRLSLIIPRDAFSLSSESVFEFPAGFVPPPDGEVVISFDSEGRLDPAVHLEPVKFAVKSPADRRTIVVGLSGTLSK
jgi:hypothetical protein